jgi:type I restriction enzyme, S subunit
LSRYLWYVTLSRPFVDWAVATSYGVKMPGPPGTPLEPSNLTRQRSDEQRRIVEVLDTEIARIDDLLGEVHQTELMVEERRWLVVAHALAGLQPSASLRRGLSFLTDGPFGSAFTSADYSDEGAAVVRLGNIGFAEWRGDDLARIPLQLFDTFRRYQVRAGDLLIASLGDERNHAGRACVAPEVLAA